jgi:hypothetical protein
VGIQKAEIDRKVAEEAAREEFAVSTIFLIFVFFYLGPVVGMNWMRDLIS